jgi:hypothetical protein
MMLVLPDEFGPKRPVTRPILRSMFSHVLKFESLSRLNIMRYPQWLLPLEFIYLRFPRKDAWSSCLGVLLSAPRALMMPQIRTEANSNPCRTKFTRHPREGADFGLCRSEAIPRRSTLRGRSLLLQRLGKVVPGHALAELSRCFKLLLEIGARTDRLEPRRLRRARGRRHCRPHLQGADRTRGPPLDVGEWLQRSHTPRGAWLRADARGGDGGIAKSWRRGRHRRRLRRHHDVPADPQDASVSRPSGQWRDDDYDVICKGAVVGRLFLSAGGPQDRQWMWIQHRTPAHGYEPSREAAMAAFARSWRRS